MLSMSHPHGPNRIRAENSMMCAMCTIKAFDAQAVFKSDTAPKIVRRATGRSTSLFARCTLPSPTPIARAKTPEQRRPSNDAREKTPGGYSSLRKMGTCPGLLRFASRHLQKKMRKPRTARTTMQQTRLHRSLFGITLVISATFSPKTE